MKTGLLVACAVSALFRPAAAWAADTDSALVLPVVEHPDQREAAFEFAERIERVLVDLGRHVEAPRRAREMFLARHSRDSADVSAERARSFVREGEAALKALERGDEGSFVRHLQQAEELVGDALEVFVRQEPERLYQLCMLDVRNSIFAGNEEEALRKAQQCDARFPLYEPAEPNPPDVRQVMDRAREIRVRAHVGALIVKSTSEEACDVRIWGSHLGQTPFTQLHPPLGRRRIQVDCGGRQGRVYVAQTGPDPVELEIDADLDRLLRTRRRERMYFASEPGDLREDLLRINSVSLKAARVVGAEAALLVVPSSQNRYAVYAITPEFIASGELDPAMSDEDVAAIVQSLTRYDGQARVTLARPNPQRVRSRRNLLRQVLGWGSLAASAGLFVGAGVTYQGHRQDGVEFRQQPNSILAGNAWLDSRVAPYAFSGMGAALAIGGADALFAPFVGQSWSWYVSGAGGVLGVALAAYGLHQVLRGGPCDPGPQVNEMSASCVLEEEQMDRGAIALMAAAPLLQLPLFHGALRWKHSRRRDSRLNLSARLGGRQVGVALHGNY